MPANTRKDAYIQLMDGYVKVIIPEATDNEMIFDNNDSVFLLTVTEYVGII